MLTVLFSCTAWCYWSQDSTSWCWTWWLILPYCIQLFSAVQNLRSYSSSIFLTAALPRYQLLVSFQSVYHGWAYWWGLVCWAGRRAQQVGDCSPTSCTMGQEWGKEVLQGLLWVPTPNSRWGAHHNPPQYEPPPPQTNNLMVFDLGTQVDPRFWTV